MSSYKPHIFVENLRRLREQRELSPGALARESGIAGGRLADFSSGEEPKASELMALARALGVSVDRLLRPLPELNLDSLRMLVMDVDGTLTDGGMYFSETGDEIKRFNTKDGRAINSWVKAGKVAGFLSGGSRLKAIEDRAERLGVTRVYVGKEKKEHILREWLQAEGIGPEGLVVIGDDVNDIAIMRMAALSACPADAVDEVREVADIVLEYPGGHGCVRELLGRYLGLEIG